MIFKAGPINHLNGKERFQLPKINSKVNISDEVVKSGVWLHINQSKTSLQEYELQKL